MTFSSGDKRALYQRVVDDLCDEIRAGKLKHLDRVPSANQLAERYGIAAMTAQRALRELQNRDLIYAIQGKGTYVTSTAVRKLAYGDRLRPAVAIRDDAHYHQLRNEILGTLHQLGDAARAALENGDIEKIQITQQEWADYFAINTDQIARITQYQHAHPDRADLIAPASGLGGVQEAGSDRERHLEANEPTRNPRGARRPRKAQREA